MNIGLYYRCPQFVECVEAWVFETCIRDDLPGIAVAEDVTHNQVSFRIGLPPLVSGYRTRKYVLLQA